MQKARLEAEFKKKMTERSSFAPVAGVKKAKKMVKKGMIRENNNTLSTGVDNNSKFANKPLPSLPEKQRDTKSKSMKIRPELYQPKGQPKLS